ncbi:MAG TPA: NUDIX hydrolase [Anaerolineae bacterium]|jgi:ADP-ribose pyrophosphatase
MPLLSWKTRSSREIYRNPWMRLREDIAELPDGGTTLYGVCEFGRAVGVLPFIDAEHVVMVRQYRYIWGESHRWEIPTGGSHQDENLTDAAQRELQEEIGFRAGRLTHISSHYTSKSLCRETADIYIGRDLIASSATRDATEDLEVAILPFAEALDLVLQSEIRDAMSVIAILWAARNGAAH